MSEDGELALETPAADIPVQETVDSAPTEPVVEESESPDVTEDQPKEQPKPGKNSFQRKMDKLHKELAEERAKAEYFQRQAQELQPKVLDQTGPKIEDFNDIEEYTEAKAKFKAEQLIRGQQANQQQELNRREQASLVSEWEKKSGDAYDKYDDFDEVVGDLKPVNALTVAIMQADNAADVAYYLGKNIQEAQRIAGLNPVAQIREIGRLEAKLASEPVAAKTPSKAPAPIVPTSGRGVNNKTIFDLEGDEYDKARRKQIAQRR